MSPAFYLVLAQAIGNNAPFPDSMPVATAPYTLQQLDTDRDGSISAAEAAAVPTVSAQFRALDANSDGALEPAEFARFDAGANSSNRRAGTALTPSPQLAPPMTPAPAGTPAPGSTDPNGPAPSQPHR